jgi:octanoyl-[GcvH]:protein N-octanoyltransferase
VLDLAVTHALLRRVAAGELEPVARVFRPGATMAFGRLDALRPGYVAAVEAARDHGYAPALRLGGGHAAGYDEGSVLVELITPARAIAEGVEQRFREGTELVVAALQDAGVDAEIGELPGEYCAGRWSVHAGGRVKVAGVAQRTIRGASLVAAAVVVEGGARLRAALIDVYAALELDWDPATAGAADDVAPGVRADDVEAAALAALRRRAGGARDAALDAPTLLLASELAGEHLL